MAEAPDEGDDASNRGSVAAVDARGASGRGTPATGGRASVSTAAGSGTSASGIDGAASIAASQHVLDQQVKQLLAHVGVVWRPHVRGCVVLCAAWVPDAGLRQVRHVVLSTVSTGRDVDGVVDSVLGTVTSLGERDVRFARYEACCMVCWGSRVLHSLTHARTTCCEQLPAGESHAQVPVCLCGAVCGCVCFTHAAGEPGGAA